MFNHGVHQFTLQRHYSVQRLTLFTKYVRQAVRDDEQAVPLPEPVPLPEHAQQPVPLPEHAQQPAASGSGGGKRTFISAMLSAKRFICSKEDHTIANKQNIIYIYIYMYICYFMG